VSVVAGADGAVERRIVRLIEWYQRAVEGRPSPCRFTPSCSAYAHEAVTDHGSRRGTWLTVRRLLRCRPFGPSGFDPVPLAPQATPIRPATATRTRPPTTLAKDH